MRHPGPRTSTATMTRPRSWGHVSALPAQSQKPSIVLSMPRSLVSSEAPACAPVHVEQGRETLASSLIPFVFWPGFIRVQSCSSVGRAWVLYQRASVRACQRPSCPESLDSSQWLEPACTRADQTTGNGHGSRLRRVWSAPRGVGTESSSVILEENIPGIELSGIVSSSFTVKKLECSKQA